MWNNTKYTVELGELVKSGVDIWAFDYPSFYKGDEKKAFEKKVIDHYYFRQIGQETVGRFLHMFRSRINDIMPYYIKRYESVKLMDEVGDPFEAYNLTETYEEKRLGKGKVTGTSSNESTSTTSTESESSSSSDSDVEVAKNATVRNLDTPQGNIENLDDGYLTSATKSNESSTTTQTDNVSSSDSSFGSSSVNASGTTAQDSENEDTVTHTLTRKGNIGVQPLGQEINAYRSALINVDLEIINELNDLFIMIY